ncbi:hypothetical protein ACET3Z_028979 [Daucus carota]
MKTLILEVVLLLVIALAAIAEEQDSCASDLRVCAGYTKATTKPQSPCCVVFEAVVANYLECLCKLKYNTPDKLRDMDINITQALQPPTLCGVPNNLCQGGNKTSPDVPASGSPNYNDSSSKNHAGRLAPAGIFSGFLIWASLTLV